jgi:hypothetical protein
MQQYLHKRFIEIKWLLESKIEGNIPKSMLHHQNICTKLALTDWQAMTVAPCPYLNYFLQSGHDQTSLLSNITINY